MDIEQYLDGFYKETKNPSLKAMEYFMEEFNHPEKKLKFIHIAGTNGKGSCVEMMNNILINAGYKVGKFISPHLVKYNERISVQNENISNEEMEELIELIKPKIDEYNSKNETKVTLFELETTMALLYFEKKNCDIVVMEVGLGGTYDCTNIINPLVSIITSVGYDHMQILGNSLLEIAENKAGIIKENSETIFVEQDEDEVNKLIENKCLEKNNKLHMIKREKIMNYSYNEEFQTFDYEQYKAVLVNLKGKKQIYNASICIECTEILRKMNYKISDIALRNGLKTVVHKARFEKIYNNPAIIYDGAHNKPAIENFNESIEMYYKNENRVYIVQILKTKDYETVIEYLLKDKNSIFIFTDGNDKKRYVAKEELYKVAEKYGNNIYMQNLNEALDNVRKNYKDYTVFIIGSFYIYGDVIDYLRNDIND